MLLAFRGTEEGLKPESGAHGESRVWVGRPTGRRQRRKLEIGVRFPADPRSVWARRPTGGHRDGIAAIGVRSPSGPRMGVWRNGSAAVLHAEGCRFDSDHFHECWCSSKAEHSLGMREGWGPIPLASSACSTTCRGSNEIVIMAVSALRVKDCGCRQAFQALKRRFESVYPLHPLIASAPGSLSKENCFAGARRSQSWLPIKS